MKKLLLIVISFIVLVGSVNAGELIDVSLVKCVDGDTAEFVINGEEKKVRFLAIDTPESVHPTKNTEFMGKEASEHTCNLLTNANSIQIEYDEKGSNTDNYGRVLAWVFVDGENVQSELVRNGYAEVAYVYYKYSRVDELCALQKTAKEEELGIWSIDRTEGYCLTKSNAKSENPTVEVRTTKTTTTKSNKEKVAKYVSQGKYEKAIGVLIQDTDNIYVIILLIVLLIIISVLGINKKKRKKRKH